MKAMVLTGTGKIAIVERPAPAVHDARRKGLTHINVRRQDECIDPVISLIRVRKIKPDCMITHRFSLDRVGRAFELLADYRDGLIKAMVDMG
jgi:L-iditol 2-dehydrogenase